MKNVFLFLLLSIFFSCKKKSPDEVALINTNWLLKTAVISPALTNGGVAQSDFMAMSGSSSCLQNNYTLSFSKDGTYALSSNGPLCDMMANINTQKWIQNGNKIILSGSPFSLEARLNNNKLKFNQSFNIDNVSHSIEYTFTLKEKQ